MLSLRVDELRETDLAILIQVHSWRKTSNHKGFIQGGMPCQKMFWTWTNDLSLKSLISNMIGLISFSLSLFLSLTLSIFETLYIHTLPLSLSLSIHCLMSTCVSDMLFSALRWTRRTKGTFQGRVISKAKLFTWLTLTNRNKPQYPSAKQSHSFTLYSDLFRRHLPMDFPIHPVDIELWKNCPATVKEALDGFLRPLA